MRPAQLRRFADGGVEALRASGKSFNEAGAAAPVCLGAWMEGFAAGLIASMRPAQLRRFAPSHHRRIRTPHQRRFNEAGAAAPVCPRRASRVMSSVMRFNEAGAAAPVCLSRSDFPVPPRPGFNEAGAAAPVCRQPRIDRSAVSEWLQ